MMAAGTSEQLMQHLNKPALLKIVFAITQGCAMLERKKFLVKHGTAPSWWPSNGAFNDYSNRTKAELEVILSPDSRGQKARGNAA